jgi:hypothetical protein
MKSLINIFLLVTSIVLLSCNKEEPVIEDDKPMFSMYIDDIKWEAGTYSYKIENQQPKIYASDNIYTLHWTFDGPVQTSTYTLGLKENKLVSAFYLYSNGKTTTLDIQSGTLTIEKFDSTSKTIKGNFEFSALNNGKTLNIKNGKFFIKF